MSKAGKLVAVALLGMTLAAGSSAAQFLPPTPPLPPLPATPALPPFPGLPPLPSPGQPVQYQACITALDLFLGPTTQDAAALREIGLVALDQHVEAGTGFADGATSALGLDATMLALVAAMEESVWVTNFTLQNVSIAVNYTRDASKPAVDDIVNGTGKIASSAVRAGPFLLNDTTQWALPTFIRVWSPLGPWMVALRLDSMVANTTSFVNWYPKLVLDGPGLPVARFYSEIDAMYAGLYQARAGAEAVPPAVEGGLAVAASNGMGFLGYVGGPERFLPQPGDISGATARFAQDAGSTHARFMEGFQAAVGGIAGATPGRAQSALASMPSCSSLQLPRL